jgi:hypothetical protein
LRKNEFLRVFASFDEKLGVEFRTQEVEKTIIGYQQKIGDMGDI